LTGSPWLRSAPLWLGGYLLVYNLDRLHYDPADQVNTPIRFLYRESLRSKRLLLIWLSAVTGDYGPVVAHSTDRAGNRGATILLPANALDSKAA
jgi:hypothetical protein